MNATYYMAMAWLIVHKRGVNYPWTHMVADAESHGMLAITSGIAAIIQPAGLALFNHSTTVGVQNANLHLWAW